jgi:UDP-N-acetylmuramoyl-tripeptide--D-alanyl-D-alanine ligase
VLGAGVLVLWTVTAWQHLSHLMRYFQLEEYKANRYLNVLWRLPQERRFVLMCGVAVILQVVLLLASGSSFVILSLSGALALALRQQRPTSGDPRQRFTPTPRARRLRATGLVVGTLLPTLSGLWLVQGVAPYAAWPPDLMAAYGNAAQGAAFAGALNLLLIPLALPLANLLNFPIEERERRYWLRLARANLDRSGATIIALTGSYGKTSTKHYLQHILSGKFTALMTPRSYNTLMGVCRVINDLLAKGDLYDYFIVEAGAYIPGEIARICQLVRPQISVVIAVGPMHLERFGSLDNIVKAKYEIIESLPSDGVGVFNADDPRVLGMASRGYPARRVLVTQQGAAGARLAATDVQMTAEGMRFTVRDVETGEQADMHMPLYGEHNVTNVLLAMAVARHVGMSLSEIAPRVATLEPAEHRLVRRVLPNGVILIDDAYSANPVGTQMALRVLASQGSQHRVVVTSGMFELGPLHEEENRKLGERIAAVATHVYLIGEAQTAPLRQGLTSAQFPPDRLSVVGTIQDAIAAYEGLLEAGDTLLLLTDLPATYG